MSRSLVTGTNASVRASWKGRAATTPFTAPKSLGCIAIGAAPREAQDNMWNLLELHLDGMAEDGLDVRSDDVVVR
jgi:hypothetical protein